MATTHNKRRGTNAVAWFNSQSFNGRVETFVPRFVPESLLSELSNLWHLSRTACATSGSTRYDRLIWTAGAFSKEHPELTSTAVYKDLDGMLEFGGR